MINRTPYILAFSPHSVHRFRCRPRRFHFSACRWSHSNDAGSAASSDTLSSLQQSTADEGREQRKAVLHSRLQQLGVDVDALSDAAFRSVATTDGFDKRFGKSAIKAYRTYIDPRPSKMAVIAREDVNVGANRIARQIDFLAKKHRSREADWVRHTDEPKESQTFPLILVLDNLRSAANVGSIYRSADACGCLEILSTGITPHPNGNGEEKLAKSALGAERVVPSKHFETTLQALTYLKEERPTFLLVGMETTDRSKCYANVKYPHVSENDGAGVALFLGNEVSGVDTDIMPLLDEVVEIPMFGKKNSLNVAACAPVVMYEVLRQWDAFP